MEQEITMELLSDLAKAIHGVARDIIPSLPLNVEVRARPQPSIVITVERDAEPVYGHIIQARAVLKGHAR